MNLPDVDDLTHYMQAVTRLQGENDRLWLALRASDNVHHRGLDHCALCEEECEWLAAHIDRDDRG